MSAPLSQSVEYSPSAVAPQVPAQESLASHATANQASSGESSKPKAQAWKVWGWLAIVAASFGVGRYFAGGHGGHGPKVTLGDSASQVSASGDAIVVTAAPVELRQVQRTISAVGTLHGFEELVLSSEVDGRVARIYHDLSSVVRPNDLLLELDSTDAALAVTQAERSLQAELAKWGFQGVPNEYEDLSVLPSVVSAKLRYELAQSRLSRMLPLEATNAVSADDLEQSRSEASIAESDLKNQILMAKAAAATARLRSADLEIARQRLRDCEIRVPQPSNAARPEDQAYTISERMVSEGTLLRPGSEVFRLVLGKTLKLKLFVPEVYTSQIAVGQEVSITVSSSSEPEPGRVARISPSIERATRTFLVEVEVPNESGRCKPGGFAKANILIGKTVDAVTVPPASVYSLAGIQKIFLMENGIAREHHVTVGQQTRDWVEIATPVISVPARVITSGQRMLSDGLPVVERQASDAKQAEDESKASFASVPGKEQTK